MHNHFTLFNLPEAFDLNEAQLEETYKTLQQKFHPDRAGKTDMERMAAARMSAMVNDAYQTLKSPLLRAEYLLKAKGYAVNSEQSAVKPSQELLEESLEAREALFETDSSEKLYAIMEENHAAQNRCIADISRYTKAEEWAKAAQETIRLRYLAKFAEEAVSRVKNML